MRHLPFLVASISIVIGISFTIGVAGSLREEPTWRQAKDDLAVGKVSEASAALEKLLQKYPQEPDLHLMFAMASLKLGDPTRAEMHAMKVLEIAPSHVDGWTFLGWLNLEVRKDFAAATVAYKRVVEMFPDSPTAHNNLGVAYKRNGELDLARKSFNRAIVMRKTFAEAWSNRGWVHFEERKWPEARQDFERALELDANDEAALHGLARVLKKTRDYRGSEAALRKLLSQSPNFVYWLEWVQVQLVWRYWVLLLLALAVVGYSRFRKMRAKANGS